MACLLLLLLLPALLGSWATAAGSGFLTLPSDCRAESIFNCFQDKGTGKCGDPMQIENAEFELTGSTRLRYSCVKDYKRKAGTSNLIVCKRDDMTKQYHWTNANLTCIRDPSKPVPLPGTTKESRQKTETSTPTRKSATPQTSVSATMVSTHPSGNPTTNSAPPSSSTGTILPTATGPLPDAAAMTASTTKIIRWLSPGIVAENTTLRERMTTPGSRARTSSQPSLKSPTTRIGSTAGPWRGTAENTTQPPSTDGLNRQTGSPAVRIVLPLLGVLIIIFCILMWYFSVRLGCFLQHRGAPPEEEIPMPVVRSEERGRTSPAGRQLGDQGPCDEQAQMLHCSPTTG